MRAPGIEIGARQPLDRAAVASGILADLVNGEPTKPSKPGFVGFVGSPYAGGTIIRTRLGGPKGSLFSAAKLAVAAPDNGRPPPELAVGRQRESASHSLGLHRSEVATLLIDHVETARVHRRAARFGSRRRR